MAVTLGKSASANLSFSSGVSAINGAHMTPPISDETTCVNVQHTAWY